MTNQYNDTDKIEAWLRGGLSEPERQGFEAQLAADAALRQEVEAYRQVFDGFDALRDERFASDVAAWTQEAKAKSPLRVVSNNSNIRSLKPVTEDSRQGASIVPMWRKLAVAASVVLLLGTAAIWWASQHNDKASLVAEAYVAPLSNGTMGAGGQSAGELERQYQQAHSAFKKGDYPLAVKEFDVFIAGLQKNPDAFDGLTKASYLGNARWSQLLAQFAAGQLTEVEFSRRLEAFKDTEFSEKAAKLQGQLGE